MPLLNICAITGGSGWTSLYSPGEEVDYNWSFEFLRNNMARELIREPLSTVTDREITLIKALWTYFPSSRHFLCWHVNMNILAETKKFFPGLVKVGEQVMRHPPFQAFLSGWNMLLDSPAMSIYTQKLAQMQATY